MNKKVLKASISVLSACSLLFGGVTAGAQELEYDNKDLWYLESENNAWCGCDTMADFMVAMSLEGSDFDVDALINSEMGEGIITRLKNVILYEETDEEVMAYWDSLGIQKELFNADDEEEKYAVYTPYSILEDTENTYPLVFCLHGGGDPIYTVEAYGYAQLGATENYITVMPQDCSVDSIVELLDFMEENYPVDETRVYSVGISAGGSASYRLATTVPELFAAITACGQPLVYNGSVTAEDISDLGGVAVYNICGQYDAYGHYPFTYEGHYSSEDKFAGFEFWLEADNLVYDGELTAEKVDELYLNSEDVVVSNSGVDFPITYTFIADGTDYWTGEFLNEDGINTLRVSIVEGGVHWVPASYAMVSWNFMKDFSRDPETRELVYSGAQAD